MKKNIKSILQWAAALVVAAAIMNTLLFAYDYSAGWINRTAGVTTAIYNPNSSMLFGTEGHGYHKIDSRGYVNDTDVLADDYVIAIGASFTQGKEVNSGSRYTDLINSMLGYTDEAYVYNVSEDGFYLPSIVQGFSALLQEFPDSDKIIIEIATTYFDVDSLKSSLVQRPYDVAQTGQNIIDSLSFADKARIFIKEKFPLLFNIDYALTTMMNIEEIQNESISSSGDIDLVAYRSAIDDIFQFLTDKYDGEIIILFHPEMTLCDDSSLLIDSHDTDPVFMDECDKFGITVVDMNDRFLQEYTDNHILPYGFSNTFYGNGHFNVNGHRMVAEELIKVLQPEEGK